MWSERRVLETYRRAKRLQIDDTAKLVMFSDSHRGTGSEADNFAPNQKLFAAAMRHYLREGFTYIELGDGDELWEERSMAAITTEYDALFALFAALYREGRFYMLYGNHDMVKRREKWARANLQKYRPGHQLFSLPLFPDISIQEAIVLEYIPTGAEILLLHGHQVDFFNDRLWRLGRFLVRHVWRPLELIGVRNPFHTAASQKRWGRVEDHLGRWAEKNGVLVVAGHTHRPVFPKEGQGLYYNDGSSVQNRYITALELSGGALTLVKWEVDIRGDNTLYVKKENLYSPRPIAHSLPQPAGVPPSAAENRQDAPPKMANRWGAHGIR